MSWLKSIINKLNPAQEQIAEVEGIDKPSNNRITSIAAAYREIDVVNRGVNLLADACSEVDIDVKDKIKGIYGQKNFTKDRLFKLLNNRPNKFQSISSFRRNIIIDLLIEGNIFLYFDGSFLYQLPAQYVTIETDPVTFISKYVYEGSSRKVFYPDEIIHIKDNSVESIYRGTSRLISALKPINILNNMQKYYSNFINDNAMPGIVLRTEHVLNDKIKERKIAELQQQYTMAKGGKRPMLLDGGLMLDSLGHTDIRELDFKESMDIQEKKVLKTLGIPPILLDSGNNANITPNLRLFYITTVLPILDKVVKEFEYFFGYDLAINRQDIPALRPDLKEEMAYYVGLVNSGIITVNESREKLRYNASDEEHAGTLRIPTNIAGSAVDPTTGGRPSK